MTDVFPKKHGELNDRIVSLARSISVGVSGFPTAQRHHPRTRGLCAHVVHPFRWNVIAAAMS